MWSRLMLVIVSGRDHFGYVLRSGAQVALSCASFGVERPLSFVLDVPAGLLMALLLALPAGEKSDDVLAKTTMSSPPLTVRAMQGLGEGPLKYRPQAWLAALKVETSAPAIVRYSKRIFKTSDGWHYVPDDRDRHTILGLRQIPAIAQGVAVRAAQRNAAALRESLGRPAKLEELYLAHRIGLTATQKLIAVRQEKPNDPAYFHVARLAPDFPIESLLSRRDVSVKKLFKFVARSMAEAVRRASSNKVHQAAHNDLRAHIHDDAVAQGVSRFAQRHLSQSALSLLSAAN